MIYTIGFDHRELKKDNELSYEIFKRERQRLWKRIEKRDMILIVSFLRRWLLNLFKVLETVPLQHHIVCIEFHLVIFAQSCKTLQASIYPPYIYLGTPLFFTVIQSTNYWVESLLRKENLFSYLDFHKWLESNHSGDFFPKCFMIEWYFSIFLPSAFVDNQPFVTNIPLRGKTCKSRRVGIRNTQASLGRVEKL